MTITIPKYCLLDVTFSHFQLIIAGSKVFLRETSGSLKLVENFINYQKGIFILYGNLVKLAIFDTHPKGTISLSRIKL